VTERVRPTVLIVDDERINRTILADLLQDDCRILLAKDGPSALERVRTQRVSLVLLDASMPGMDGYEVLRRMKADPATANISVIFVTGQTEEEDEERGLRLGAADYVAKPIRPLLVRARVLNHLKLATQREELERQSLQDGLTGIANRRHFDEELVKACRDAGRTREVLGVALIDVDHFKQFNDHYGHTAGDEALRIVAQELARTIRPPYDLAARYGGEEFALLLPGITSLPGILESVRTNIERLRIPHEASRTIPFLTVSCGGTTTVDGEPRTPEHLLSKADAALYRAKDGGRNRALTA
jgi:diguanylate cyclase (GGDEF)-like protein